MDTKLHDRSNRKMSLPDSWMVWKYHGIPFFYFYFSCLEAMVKGTLEWERFSSRLKLLDISCFQSSQQLRGTLTTAFVRHLTIENFSGMESPYVLIASWINILKWKWAKMPCKLLVPQKSEPVLWRTLHKIFRLLLYSSFSLKQI